MNDTERLRQELLGLRANVKNLPTTVKAAVDTLNRAIQLTEGMIAPSFAPSTGPAAKLSESGSVSPAVGGESSAPMEATGADFRSTPSIEDAFEATLRSCLILLSMLRSPMPSGSMPAEAGDRGPAGLDCPACRAVHKLHVGATREEIERL